MGQLELTRQILLALPPTLGLSTEERVELARVLTAKGLARTIQTSGQELGTVPGTARLANGQSASVAPGAARYAAPGHLAAENAILRSAGERGRPHVDSAAAAAWLDADLYGAALTPAQRQAVIGLAATDARLAVLVGPAGSGKSTTAGVLAAAWSDLTGGRVVGLATAESAAQVLAEDGLSDSANIARFLAAQSRIVTGRAVPEDDRWRLTPGDLVVVDEASMLDTTSLAEIQAVADRTGAGVVLMGDPHQLGAVGAGGMMRTAIDRQAETYSLSEVRRFNAEWERQASLDLREGAENAVLAYDVHGQIRDAGTHKDAVAAIARAAAADRLSGHQAIVTCTSNEDAAAVASAIRSHLVTAGAVEETGVFLGRDGNTAGVGDIVQARRVERGLGLINRHTYTVTGVRANGSLEVKADHGGQSLVIPRSYVDADVTLAYASTVHSAQGATVDTGHLLLTPNTDRASAYVGMTRGRDHNTAWAVTESGIEGDPTRTSRGMLSGAIVGEVDDEQRSATDDVAADVAWRTNAATILGAIEEETRIACRARLDDDLDQLVAEGILSEEERGRFGADQGVEHLSRQLRALEQAGHDPTALLRAAIADRPLTTADFVAQATAGRIEKMHGLPTPAPGHGLPDRLPAAERARLADLHSILDDRTAQLSEQIANEPPVWATAALGPVPESADRASWQQRAGQIATVREATGWTSETAALGRAPGAHSPEKRAAWHQAYVAAGAPEERRPDADLSDGRLLVRIAAGERVLANAPASAYEAQRHRHMAADTTARESVLARAGNRVEEARRLADEATTHAEAAARLDDVAATRNLWLVAHAETLTAYDNARAEAERRGLAVGREPDRKTTAEYLAEAAAQRAADDDTRQITETDVLDPAREDGHVDTSAQIKSWSAGAPEARSALSAGATFAEISTATAAARQAQEQLADQRSQDAAEPSAENEEWLRRREATANQQAAATQEAGDAADVG